MLGYYTTTGLRTYPGQVRKEKTTFFYSLVVGLRNRLWFYSLNDKGSWEKDLVCCDESLILVQSESSALRLMLIGRMRRVVLQNGKIGKTGNGTQWTGTHLRRSSSDKLFKLFWCVLILSFPFPYLQLLSLKVFDCGWFIEDRCSLSETVHPSGLRIGFHNDPGVGILQSSSLA